MGPAEQIASFKRRIAAFATAHGCAYSVVRDEPHCFQYLQTTSSANPSVASAGTSPCVWTKDVVCRIRSVTNGARDMYERHVCQQVVGYNCRYFREAGWTQRLDALVDEPATEMVFEDGLELQWGAARGRYQVAA